MATTTIPVDQRVRDRLKRFGHAGQTYNDILTRMMDEIERERFVAQMRKEIDTVEGWVDLDDVE